MMFCAYCGKARDFCCRDCGENHLVSGAEFYAENGELAEDDQNTVEDYATQYAQEQCETAQSLAQMPD